MDFEKEYKDMVQRARELHESGNALTKQQMEIVCPALAESEDEMIRKKLVEYISDWKDGQMRWNSNKEFCSRALAYLEKQKEQKLLPPFDEMSPEEKMNHPLYLEGFDVGREVGEVVAKPAEWSEEDEAFLKVAIAICNRYSHKDIAGWLKSLRLQPKQKRHLGMKDQWCCNAAWAAVRDSDAYSGEEKQFILDFLQRCNPQPHWRPSEIQMKALLSKLPVVKGGGDKIQDILESLYDDLKKLL